MKGRALALLVAAGALATSGCLHSRVEEEWGQAEQETVGSQVANPNASAPAEGPQNLDPVTAEKAAADYYKGRQQQAPSGPSMIFQEVQ